MAQAAVRSCSQLDEGWVLAPERYDPRREAVTPGTPLSQLVRIVREHVAPRSAPAGRYLVLDTRDAKEGVVLGWKPPVDAAALGSAKKVVEPGDVVISRLRPYLRQVAYIDDGLTGPQDLVCSTEFYVLRSRDESSIAFLVAFLLSTEVQRHLGAAQEGGHHPRFSQETLERLVVPDSILDLRRELCARVEASVASSRDGQRGMAQILEEIDG